MNALLAQFIPEARDLVEQAGTGMLALERDATSARIINEVFRAVHTLKGSSGLFEIGPFTRLVHAAEDLLGEARAGQLALTSDMIDQLLDSLDTVSRWIDALESTEALPRDAEAMTETRAAALRRWLERGNAADAATAAAVPDTGVAPAPPWILALPESTRRDIIGRTAAETLTVWSFNPEEDCFFRGDDPVAMVRQSPGLLTLRVGTRQPLGIADFDPLASVLQFEVLSDAEPAAIETHMRYVAENVELRTIAADSLAFASGTAAHGPVFADFGRLAREQLATGAQAVLARSLDSLARMIAPESLQASALRWCMVETGRFGLTRPDRILQWIATIEAGKPTEARTAPAGKTTSAASHADPHRDLAKAIALAQVEMLASPGAATLDAGRIEAAATVLRRLVQALGVTDDRGALDAALAAARTERRFDALQHFAESLGDEAVPVVAEIAKAPPPQPKVAASQSATPEPVEENRTAVPRVLRVDQSKIDTIMNLVAELIVAKNGLSYLATRAEQVHGARIVAREIKDQFGVIDRITQGLQVGVMSVRMMPVSQTFQRFPRLVRDIARKLGKSVELVIEGEDTEADKNVLENLADPLIHMVRNCLDHGIEPPEQRRAAGKPEAGTLRISARQESDFVVIEVADDGRGIDPEAVKAKALAQGLITADQASAMTDREAANLVFAAGFSTKEVVSDLSGRGVGMDVVRSAVTKAGGEVSLMSELGRGTTVTLRLPLTMAVTRIVTIACSDRLFGIPMDLVVETVKIGRSQIHHIKDAETFVLRDTIIPLVRLASVLGLPSEAAAVRDEEAVMVVKAGRERIGMIVDGFRERLEVIVKPLEGMLEGLSCFSGTALLGDGRVLLILDPRETLLCR